MRNVRKASKDMSNVRSLPSKDPTEQDRYQPRADACAEKLLGSDSAPGVPGEKLLA